MRKFLVVAPLLLIAACVSPAPPPPSVRRPAPVPPPPPAPPVSQDWRDFPLTPGIWAYAADSAGSSATFGRAGVEADLIVRCDRASRTITLSWAGVPMPAGNATTITTSAGVVTYPAGAVSASRIGVRLAAGDPFLDKIAFSRGRFVVAGAVSAQAAVRLVIPAWPEPARAIEDCRK